LTEKYESKSMDRILTV